MTLMLSLIVIKLIVLGFLIEAIVQYCLFSLPQTVYIRHWIDHSIKR